MIKISHRYLLLLLSVWLCLSTQNAAGQGSPNAAPQVTAHSTNTNQVGRYQKFEVTFQISRTYPADSILPYYFYDPADPRGVDGITVDGHFVSPAGREMVVPAFYYQDYVRSGTGSITMTPTSNFSWKLRFAPEETGTYNYYITVVDKSGSSRYPASGTLQFQSAESTSRGFVRVSSRDPRFLEFSNGESYIPNSAGRQWWMPGSPLRSLDYDQVFNEFGRNGINLTRIWDQNDGYALTVEGHFDAYKYPDDFNPEDRGVDLNALPKGTQMNQRGNYEEDKIIEAAERNGVYILLCSHADAYWIWDASIYNNPPAGWNDAARLRQWQRNFRYRVARWGYSTAVLAWEHWNELGHVSTSSDIYKFYQTYGQYQQQTDPYRHLRTTSQGSQSWSPAFWTSSAFDIATYHDYMMISRYSAELTYDAANFVYRFAQCLRTPDGRQCGLGIGDGSTWQGGPRPILWGELDTGTTNWNESNPQPKATHDMRWAGLFSPIGMSPIDWYFNKQSDTFTATKYREAKIASDFFKGVDYAGKGFTYLSTADVRITSEVINVSNPGLRVLAMRASGGSEVYAWAQNKGNARWDQSAAPSPLSATFTIPGMAAGNYTVEIWDTYSGQITNGSTVSASSGQVTIPVSNLTKDVAIKIRSTNQPAATPTMVTPTVAPTATPPPTSTPVTPTATPTTLPPTATATPLPPTATVVTAVPTSGAPTTTPAMPNTASLQISANPPAAAPGASVDVTLALFSVTNLYGLEVACSVNPAVLAGTSYKGGDAFNDSNALFVDQGFRPDGSWVVAATRLRPHAPVSGDITAFSLRYTVLGDAASPITCAARAVDANGHELPLTVLNTSFNQPGSPTATPPPGTLIAPTPTDTTATPPATPATISGVITFPGRSDHAGITVALADGDTPLAQLTTSSSGAYRFTDVPTGVYTLTIRAPQALPMQQTVTVETTGAGIDLGETVLPMGDTDGNDTIDLADAALVSANYGVEASRLPSADLNADAVINLRDLVLVGSSFGLSAPVPLQ